MNKSAIRLPRVSTIAKFIECPMRLKNIKLVDVSHDRVGRTEQDLLRPTLLRTLYELHGGHTPRFDKLLSTKHFKKTLQRTTLGRADRKVNVLSDLTQCNINLCAFIAEKQFTNLIAVKFPLFQAGIYGFVDLIATSEYGTYIVLLKFNEEELHHKYFAELEVACWAVEKILNSRSIKRYWINFPMLYYPKSNTSFMLPRTRDVSIDHLMDAYFDKKYWHNRSFCDRCEIPVCNIQRMNYSPKK